MDESKTSNVSSKSTQDGHTSERKNYVPGDEAKLLEAARSGTRDDTIEQLAAYAHAAWAGWTEYLFSKCASRDDGSLTIPAEYVQRWRRQIATAYVDLPESEKASDRKEAMVMCTLMNDSQ